MATSDPPHLTEKESRSVTAPGPIQESPQPALAIERLVSLDAFRGFIMFWIIGGEALARKSGRASRQAAEAQTEQEVIDLGAAELTLEKKPVAWGLGVLPWDGLVHRVLARA